MCYRYILPIAVLGSSAILGGVPAWAQPASGAASDALQLVIQASPEESVTSVACSPDGRFVVSGSFDGRVRVHEARTGAVLRAVGGEPSRGVRAVAFAPDGKTLATAGYEMDKKVRLWDIQTGSLVRALVGHEVIETYAVAIAPDGRFLASSGTDRQVLVWDLATGTLRHRLVGNESAVTALAFAPDGKTLGYGTRRPGGCSRRSRATATGCAPWRSLRMARPWPAEVAIGRTTGGATRRGSWGERRRWRVR
jgi:WD40 repeat protein